MKRLCCIALSACMACGLGFSQAFAADAQKVTAELRPDYTIVIDGAVRTFYSASGKEAQPMYYNGTSYLPLRAIGELMGKNVNWDQGSLTVTIGGQRQAVTTGTPDASAVAQKVGVEIRPDFTIIIDGTARTFKDANGNVVYPILYDGVTYLPIRAIGEIMGKTVAWDQSGNTVTLSGGTIVTDADSFNPGGQTTAPANPGVTPSTPSTGVTQPSAGDIGSEKAKEIALSHAGVSAANAQFVQVKRDYEDGRLVYEVEFYTEGYKEYDYEIDAATGNVLKYDYDAEYFAPGNTSSTTTTITEARAKEIALSKVAGATAANIVKFKVDYDDGRTKYEGTIVYNLMEYDFEIDASTGNILEWDAESVYD